MSAGATRIAIGGALLLGAGLAAVLLADSSDEIFPTGGDSFELFVYDADAHGAILEDGEHLLGVDRDGRERWRLGLDSDLIAVCLERCPDAELTELNSLDDRPVEPDGPRTRLVRPSWKPEPQRPRLRIDRPLLGGRDPARVTIRGPSGNPVLDLAGAEELPLSSALPSYFEAAGGGRAAFLDRARSRLVMLEEGPPGWSVAGQRQLGRKPETFCLSADGAEAGLLGGGPPELLSVFGSPAQGGGPVPDPRPGEGDAFYCGIGGGVFSTAVARSGGKNPTILYIRGDGETEVVKVGKELIDGPWVSAATGTTAIQVPGEVMLFGPAGRARTWSGVAGVLQTGADELLLVGRDLKFSVKAF